MATNRALKTALLKRLGVTSQRLSQRVRKMYDDHGPMSTEQATYVIAYQEGLGLEKYLDKETIDEVRSLVPREAAKQVPAPKKKRQRTAKRTVVISIKPDISQIDALLSTTLARDAKKMAEEVYPRYYVLENSIRDVIKRILEDAHGKGWWQTRVKKDVKDKVAGRKKKEDDKPWHGKRGQHEIFYTDFRDLSGIITKNWSDFEPLLDSQAWLLKLGELEHPRNVLAHHNPVSPQDLRRIELYLDDWVELLKSKKHLVP